MRYTGKKGWVASYKDTWSVQHAMDPMIVAIMKKFIEVMEGNKGDYFGVPCCDLEVDKYDDNEDNFDARLAEWEGIIREIYAGMTAVDPSDNYDEYDFNVDLGNEPYDEEYGGYPVKFTITNQDEYDRFNAATKAYEERLAASRALFFKYYSNLWW